MRAVRSVVCRLRSPVDHTHFPIRIHEQSSLHVRPHAASGRPKGPDGTDAYSGIAYPIQGIFGFYKGYFSTIPYYFKFNEYPDTENRDIWEYRLNFTEV